MHSCMCGAYFALPKSSWYPRFHFDTAAGGGLVQPCEAAYLAALDTSRAGNARAPPVKVLVMYATCTPFSQREPLTSIS